MPFSVLLQATEKMLKEHNFMPPKTRPDDFFTGVLIERRGGQVIVHERHEVGVMRLSPTVSTRFADIQSALRRFIEANGGDNVDGVDISFDA
jgi:hypothetical protein